MFRRSSKEGSARKRGAIEKIVMGAIIGTAVGSVLGLTVAPKKGADMRDDVKEIGKLTKETAEGLFSIAKRLLDKNQSKPVLREKQGLKKIPNEMIEETKSEWVIPDQEK